jgi:hypothetical protein
MEEDIAAPIQNNFFYSREKYSSIDHNRKKIKGIKASHTSTNPSLRCSINNIEAVSKEVQPQQRPYSSFVRKSDQIQP